MRLRLSEAEETARSVPPEQKYSYDVFSKMEPSGGFVNGIGFSMKVEDTDGNMRKDLVFRFDGNPFVRVVNAARL